MKKGVLFIGSMALILGIAFSLRSSPGDKRSEARSHGTRITVSSTPEPPRRVAAAAAATDAAPSTSLTVAHALPSDAGLERLVEACRGTFGLNESQAAQLASLAKRERLQILQALADHAESKPIEGGVSISAAIPSADAERYEREFYTGLFEIGDRPETDTSALAAIRGAVRAYLEDFGQNRRNFTFRGDAETLAASTWIEYRTVASHTSAVGTYVGVPGGSLMGYQDLCGEFGPIGELASRVSLRR